MNNPCRKGTFSEKLFDLMLKAKDLGERKPIEISFYDGNSSRFSIAVNKLAARYCPHDCFSAEKKGEKMEIVYYGVKSYIPKPERNTAKNYLYRIMEYATNQQIKEVVIGPVLSRNDKTYSHSSIVTAVKSLSIHFPSYSFYTRTCQQTSKLIIGCKFKEVSL